MAAQETSQESEPSAASRVAILVVGILVLAALVYLFVVAPLFLGDRADHRAKEFVKYLNDHGVAAGPPQPVGAALDIGGAQGFRIDVAGQPFWLYTFNTSDPTQANTLQAIRANPLVSINGKPRPGKLSGSLMLAGYDGHRQADKLLALFADYESQ